MSLLSDKEIVSRLQSGNLKINPFVAYCPKDTISYGVSHYGYDVRLGYSFKFYDSSKAGIVDPKHFDKELMYSSRMDVPWDMLNESPVVIPAHSFALAETLEWIEVPRDCLALVADKSTIRRCGLLLGFTVLEPEWKGKVTLEITNATPLPVKLYCGEGIAQILFLKADKDSVCSVSYADKKGKYQDQPGVTLPR